MKKFRLLTIKESLMLENFPPGAASDSRAPYNQPSAKIYSAEFDDELEDEEGVKDHIHIKYWYEEDRDGRKYVNDYSPDIKTPDIDRAIRDLISDHIGKNHEFTI